jgi:protein pelota
MKLQGKVQIGAEGDAEFSVLCSGAEDMWHLYNFIVPGDIVGTKTVRKVVKETATGSGTAERRVLTLHILVEHVEFDGSGEPATIRLAGINKTETEWVKMNSHHTLTISSDPPQTVKVHKREWNEFFADRLREACDEDSRADTAAIVMDYGIAHVCLINGSLVQTKSKIELTIQKKRKMNGSSRDESINRFFGLIYESLLQNVNLDKVKVVLVCSPGTIRDEFMSYVNKKLSGGETLSEPAKLLLANRQKLLPVLVSSGQRNAINEALADRNIQHKVSATKCAADIKSWNQFQELLTMDPDRVCYGPQYVQAALNEQAIEVLLISDTCFRHPDARLRKYYIAVADDVQQFGGVVNVFSSQHTTGEALTKISGIAAILRMPMPQLEDVEQDLNFLQSEQVDEMVRSHTKGGSETMSEQRTSSSGIL